MNTNSLLAVLIERGILHDERVTKAFGAVPRHHFLPGIDEAVVYSDNPVYTATDDKGGFTGGSDRPSETAQMLAVAKLAPGMNVLEIGTGTGYSAALIQHIVGREGNVTTLEIDKQAAESAKDHLQRVQAGAVNVVNVDGAAGYDQRASYDRIISSVAVWDIPPAWLRQLRPGGMIITPIYLDGLQVSAAFTVEADSTLFSPVNTSCSFVGIKGLAAPPPQHLYMGGGSALRIYSNEVNELDSASLHLLMQYDAENCHLGVAPTNRQYWDGFVPYLMLNTPPEFDFVCYAVEGSKQVYGLHGYGFALITQGSATFVNADERGNTHCFAGVDAFLAVDAAYQAWEAQGKPMIDRLRLRFVPKGRADTPPGARVFPRSSDDLWVWLAAAPS